MRRAQRASRSSDPVSVAILQSSVRQPGPAPVLGHFRVTTSYNWCLGDTVDDDESLQLFDEDPPSPEPVPRGLSITEFAEAVSQEIVRAEPEQVVLERTGGPAGTDGAERAEGAEGAEGAGGAEVNQETMPDRLVVCAICQHAMAPGDIQARLQCNHVFHERPCVTRWLAGHRTCPVCRASVI